MIDAWYLEHLACPKDRSSVHADRGRLVCAAGHAFAVVEGIPVMLRDDAPQTIGLAAASLGADRRPTDDDPALAALHVETLGLSDTERDGVRQLARSGRSRVDPVVAYLVGATNGLMYEHLIGALDRYPIPELRLPPAHGERLLDVGCSWGRWSIAAAGLGYDVVGMDPSLGAVLAARRVAASLGLAARFVVGDARFLPFHGRSFDRVFSYSVLQHLSRDHVRLAVDDMARVTAPAGSVLVQMPTRFGIRCLYHQARRRFREAAEFEVRYWTIPQLRRLFGRIGPAAVSVDCFFGIGLQRSDAALMPARLKVVLAASEALRAASGVLRPLVYLADSVYVTAQRAG